MDPNHPGVDILMTHMASGSPKKTVKVGIIHPQFANLSTEPGKFDVSNSGKHVCFDVLMLLLFKFLTVQC